MRKTQKIMQFGRSMTEMLGVIAIIGVLSIASVWLWRQSIDKQKANDLIYDVNMISGVIATNEEMAHADVDESLVFDEYTKRKTAYEFTSYKETDDIFSVNAAGVSKGVCRQVLNGVTAGDLIVTVNKSKYSDVAAQGECTDENTLNFYYNPTNTPKCGGKICQKGRYCNNDTCQCPPRKTLDGEECVCSAEYANTCGDGNCYELCSGDGEFDCMVRQCICPEPTHLERLEDNRCVCPSGTEEWADGKCHQRACTGGTAGKQNWTCEIDGKRCGYNCTQNGLTCNNGICDMGLCPSGTTHVYHEGQNIFGCQNASGLTCMYNRASSRLTYCYHPSDEQTFCCVGTLGGACSYGMCDPSLCPEGTHYGKMTASYGYANLSGCWKDDGSLQCTKVGSNNVICATADKAVCGKGCTYDGICTGTPNFCPKEECEDWEKLDKTTNECIAVCPEGTTYQKVGTTNRCYRDDGVYCRLDGNNALYCYLPNGKYCGHTCPLDGHGCSTGTCDASDCPSDLIHQYVISAYAGCYNPDTGIACYPTNTARTKWTCYQNGVICAGTCTDYYGNGCCQEFSCPAGTQLKTKFSYSGHYYNACYNSVHDTTCLSSKTCIKNGVSCGSNCNLDGTGCTSASKCVESECGSGKTLVFVNGAWSCQATSLNCTGGACTINGSKCGTGCDEDGRNCSYGICNQADCDDGTYLVKVDTNTFGCKNATGVACYPENDRYTCVQGGAVCATGCGVVYPDRLVNCTQNTCQMTNP